MSDNPTEMEFAHAMRVLAAFARHGVDFVLVGYRMKKDTVRPQDRLDAETLRQRFGIQEG